MNIALLSSSYKTASIEVREQLAVSKNEVKSITTHLKQSCDIEELVILSTCNRIEIYFVSKNLPIFFKQVKEAFLHFFKKDASYNFGFVEKDGKEAIEHLFRVTSSLESLVIGEPQILGQVKEAYQVSSQLGGCKFILNKVFHHAFSVAKKIRNTTNISRFAVSISFAAVELAKKIFNQLEDKVILVIGAGEMAELAISHLIKAGCKHLVVLNRTFSNAVTLAEKYKGSAVPYSKLEYQLSYADIVISSTGAKDFIITPKIAHSCIQKRKHKPMFFIDIALPRDIHPELNEISNVYAYDIDDLQGVIDTNLKERKKAAQIAKSIVKQEVENFLTWMKSIKSIPTIKAFREHIKQLSEYELQKTLQQLGDISTNQKKIIEKMMHSFTNKLLHEPTITMREQSSFENFAYLEMIQELFQLKPDQNKNTQSSKVIPFKS